MSLYDDEREDTTIYKVVVNHEEQYSIWPADRENALGWSDAGKQGTKAECLAYIEEVWTDMRPLSLRKKMEEQAAAGAAPEVVASDSTADAGEDDLIERLSAPDQRIELSLRPEKSVGALRERLDMGYLLIKFTDTRGGTELGVRLDRDAVNLSDADFDNQKGTVHVEGGLTLNYRKIRCIADVSLETFTGRGRLQALEA